MRDFEPDMVDDGLWVGRAPTGPEDYALLQSIGIDAVVTLQTEQEARSIGLRPEVSFRLAAAHGIVEYRVPIEDFDRTSLEGNAGRAADLVEGLVRKGRKVYLHCAVGLNRSPTVAALYLARTRKLSAGEACDLVEEAHPSDPQQVVVDSLLASDHGRG